MKKILLFFMMCALLPRVAGAQGLDGTFEVSDLFYDNEVSWNDDANTGAYGFTISLSSTSTYSAYNLDIFLPAGIQVIFDTEEDCYLVRRNNADNIYPKTSGEFTHSISSAMPNVHQLRIACVSTKNKDFKQTSGKLFNVYVTIDNAVFASSFSPKPIVKLSGMNLTTSSEEKYVPADFSCRPFTTGIPTGERTLPINVSAANKIGTLILPFDAALPSGLKAYSCSAASGDLLTLTEASSFEACKPYIVYAETGYSGNISGTVDPSADYGTTDVFAEGYLTGVLTNTTVSSGYILQNQGSGPMFYDAEGATFSLPAGRCYLTPGSSSVKAFNFSFDDTTSINDVLIMNNEESDGSWYDLCGRKVINPSRGIYIKGTRKVVIK